MPDHVEVDTSDQDLGSCEALNERKRVQRHRLRLTEERREHLRQQDKKQREFSASKRVIYAAHTV